MARWSIVNLAQLLLRASQVARERPALAHGPTTLATYATLMRDAAAFAGGIAADLRPGDRVALVMQNCPEYVTALFGCWSAGLVAVPVNAKLHPEELAYIFAHSGAKVVLATPGVASVVDRAARACGHAPRVTEIGTHDWHRLLHAPAISGLHRSEPDDPAWIFYTSGTTGRPKGATLSHRNLLAMTLGYFSDVGRVGPGSGLLHAAPMSHGSGLYMLPFVAGMGLQIVPESAHFEPAEIFELAMVHREVSLFAAPTMVRRLTAAHAGADWDPKALSTIVYGGGPMYVEDCKAALKAFGPRLAQIYGQGESPMTITVLPTRVLADDRHPRWEARLASVGYAQAVVEVRAVDEQDRPVPAGEAGEIVVRGDSVMSGYWGQPDASAETLRGGWLHTGDVGAFDVDGFLTLKDRAKDVIISGGSNIYPREVEEVLLRHADVTEVSVVGRPNPEWGEDVVAFVVSRPGCVPPRPEVLGALCESHIARFKRPREYRYVESLPKNEYGKVLKTRLRQLLASDAPSTRCD